MSDAVAIALISSFSALAVAGITAYYGWRSNMQILELKDIVEDQQTRIIALEGERDQNRRTIDGWRKFWGRFVTWLKSQNLTGYPEPDDDLLDTGEHKAVGK